MNLSGFNTKKLSRIMAVLFVVYLSVSLLIIVFPKMNFGKRATQIYKRYISPGPFFTASRITDTKLLYLSWKSDGKWQGPINPPLVNYRDFLSKWNPTLMYKSRLERSLYEEIINENKKQADSVESKPFEWSSTYFQKNYVPPDTDSIRIVLINSSTQQYKTQIDTLKTIVF